MFKLLADARPTRGVTIEKIRAASTAWLASDRLRREIHLGKYVPGDKLPPQRQLACKLGVSLMTLREALRILEAEGYLTMRRGATGGAIITASRESVEVLQERLRSRIDEFAEWMEFREAVEAAAARLAAGRISAQEIAGLRTTLAQIGGEADVQSFRSADSAFHLGLAQASRNQLIRQAVEDARAAMFLAFDAVPHLVVLESTVSAHERILAAVAAHDRSQAERSMAEHIRTSWEEIRSIIEGRLA